MTLALSRVDAGGRDRDALTAFLTGNVFPFHVRERLDATQVTADIDAGRWGDDRTEAFWIDDDERGRLGLVRLEDLDDPTAMIDLRLAERWRGHGVGAEVLPLAVEHAFRMHAGLVRVEGHTREDNMAMRRTFEKSGWVREGWFRDGWPVVGAPPLASVAYAVLRREWAGGFDVNPGRAEAGAGSAATVDVERRDVVRQRGHDADLLAADAWAGEERLLDPAVRADADRLEQLLADDFTEIGQSGRHWTRSDMITALTAEPAPSRPPVIEERRSRTLGPDTVLLTYVLRSGDGVSRRSSVWRCDPLPRCVFHQGTRVPA